VYFLRLHVRGLRSRGLIEAATGDLAAAAGSLDAATRLVERCLARQPRDRSLLIVREELLIQSAQVAGRAGDPGLAWCYLLTARDDLRALAAEYPNTPEFAHLLRQAADALEQQHPAAAVTSSGSTAGRRSRA
jgi:hypothetical protein